MMRVLTFLLLALTATVASAEPMTLRIAIGEYPHQLDPHVVMGHDDTHLAGALFEGLLQEDPKTHRPVPGVAERWEVSEDGKVWTFHLRKNAKWSNGEAVSARDFHWSWKRALSPKLRSRHVRWLWDIAGAETYSRSRDGDFSRVGVVVVDRHTLRVTLRGAAPHFAHVLTTPVAAPVHRFTVEEFGERWTRPENIVTNGPFLLGEWSPAAHIRLEKSPVYWDAKSVRLDRVDAFVRGEGSALFGFVNRQIDWNHEHWPTTALPAVKQHEAYRAVPSLTTQFLRVNVRRGPLADVRVRRALSHAIDKKAIVAKVLKGGETPAHGFVPPVIEGYESPQGRRHDPASARKLLAEAGYPDGKGFPRLDFVAYAGVVETAIARRIAADLKRTLGIEVRVLDASGAPYQKKVREGAYDLALAGWAGDWPDPGNFLDLFATGGWYHETGYASPLYDRLHLIARGTPAFIAAPDATLYTKVVEAKRLRGLVAIYRWREARMLVLKEMDRLLVERDCPIVPLCHGVQRDLLQPHVRGFHPNPLGIHPLRGFWIER